MCDETRFQKIRRCGVVTSIAPILGACLAGHIGGNSCCCAADNRRYHAAHVLRSHPAAMAVGSGWFGLQCIQLGALSDTVVRLCSMVGWCLILCYSLGVHTSHALATITHTTAVLHFNEIKSTQGCLLFCLGSGMYQWHGLKTSEAARGCRPVIRCRQTYAGVRCVHFCHFERGGAAEAASPDSTHD